MTTETKQTFAGFVALYHRICSVWVSLSFVDNGDPVKIMETDELVRTGG